MIAKLRRKWKVHPATQIKQSNKHYDRNKMKEETKHEGKSSYACQKCKSSDPLCYAQLYDRPGKDKQYYRCNKCLHIFIKLVNNMF